PELARVLAQVHDLAALTEAAGSHRDVLYLDTIPVRELSRDVRTAERFDSLDKDGLEARLVDLARDRNLRRARRGRERAYGANVARDTVWSAYESTMTALDRFQRDADADLAALLHVELRDAVAGYER